MGATARVERGFTLVEILVALIVIGILAAVILPNFAGAQDRSRNASVQNNVHLLQQAVEEWGADINQKYPDHLSGGVVGGGRDYLTGDTYPATPWDKQQAAGTDLGYDGATESTVYTTVQGTALDPTSTADYGAIGFTNDVPGGTSDQYQIAGTGKKDTHPMLVLVVGNTNQ